MVLSISLAAVGLGASACEGDGEASSSGSGDTHERSVTGEVADGFGQPLEGATVSGGEGFESVKTGADGSFELGYSGRRPEELVVSKPGYTQHTVEFFQKLEKGPVSLLPVPEEPGIYRIGEEELSRIELARLEAGNHPANFLPGDFGSLPGGELTLLLKGDVAVSGIKSIGSDFPISFSSGTTLNPIEHTHQVTGGGELETQRYTLPQKGQWALANFVPYSDSSQMLVPEDGRAYLFSIE